MVLRPNRRVLFVAAEFPPCNLTAGHRTRLFLRHLPDFGYDPIVLTLRPECYETPVDMELLALVSPDARVIRTGAMRVRPIRFVGDLGLRSLSAHREVAEEMARRGEVDLLFHSIFPAYAPLIGAAVWRKYRVPYVVDYQDPWVYPVLPEQWYSPKAIASHLLARLVEPRALTGVRGLCGVARSYYQGVIDRHPSLRRLPNAAIPFGAEFEDIRSLETAGRRSLVLPASGLKDSFVITYAGVMPFPLQAALRVFLLGCREARETDSLVREKLRLLFVGTGSRPSDPMSHIVQPIAVELGCEGWVTEVPNRQSYTEALATVAESAANVILGSTATHYTASKLFQLVLVGRPLIALLQEKSSAVQLLAGVPGAEVIPFDSPESLSAQVGRVAVAVRTLVRQGDVRYPRNPDDYTGHSAREMTRRLAGLFDAVFEHRDGIGT